MFGWNTPHHLSTEMLGGNTEPHSYAAMLPVQSCVLLLAPFTPAPLPLGRLYGVQQRVEGVGQGKNAPICPYNVQGVWCYPQVAPCPPLPLATYDSNQWHNPLFGHLTCMHSELALPVELKAGSVAQGTSAGRSPSPLWWSPPLCSPPSSNG